MHCPDAFSYFFKISNNLMEDDISTWQKIRLSSVKRRWFISEALRHTLIPLKLLCAPADCKRLIKPSVQSNKRYGEKGSSYLKPRLGVIRPLDSPLINTEKVADFTQRIRRCIKWGKNYRVIRTYSKNFTLLCRKPCSYQV